MELKPFNFRGHNVRVLVAENGEPLWVGRDVCAVLEIKNSRDALSRIDPEGVGIADTLTPGGIQKLKVVNESGLVGDGASTDSLGMGLRGEAACGPALFEIRA
ncbi:hypothetical protein CIP107527_00146 [Corynebacterium diphtheriae]|nr:hypothetical protein CIP107527_00146 [Corynebacterium diphtheriae]